MKKNFFKDIPSALRDEEDIKQEQNNRKYKRIFAIAAVAVTSLAAAAIFSGSDEKLEEPQQRQSVNTLDNG